MPILQMGKLKPQKVKQLAWDHIAKKPGWMQARLCSESLPHEAFAHVGARDLVGWAVGQKAGVTGLPHRVKLCDKGVPGVLQGDENFLEERRLSQAKERVQEESPSGGGARAQPG